MRSGNPAHSFHQSLARVLLRCVLVVLVITPALAAAQSAMETRIIDTLGGESLIPVIQPMLAEGGRISHYRGRLVIRSTPENLAEISALIADIDQPPRPVRITLRRHASSSDSQRDAGVRIEADRDGRVDARVQASRRDSARERQDDYHITTLDGHEAFIDRGQLLQLAGYAPGSREILPLLQGIAVRPRLLPDGRVQLDISQRFDERHSSGQLETQSAQSTLLLHPAQWQALGSLQQDDAMMAPGHHSDSTGQINLEVRVEFTP